MKVQLASMLKQVTLTFVKRMRSNFDPTITSTEFFLQTQVRVYSKELENTQVTILCKMYLHNQQNLYSSIRFVIFSFVHYTRLRVNVSYKVGCIHKLYTVFSKTAYNGNILDTIFVCLVRPTCFKRVLLRQKAPGDLCLYDTFPSL